MTESDPTIDVLLAEYMQKVDSGEPFDRDEFFQQHVEHANELRELLEADDLVRQLRVTDGLDLIPPTINRSGPDTDAS